MKIVNKLYLYGLLIGTLGLIAFPIITLIIGCILGSQLITKEKLIKGITVIFISLFCGLIGILLGFFSVQFLVGFCLWLCMLFITITLIHIGWE